MVATRSHEGTNPPVAKYSKPTSNPNQKPRPPPADKPKATSKRKLKEHVEDIDTVVSEAPPAARRRKTLTMPPRDPLPDRGTARQDIGGPDRPRPKRTSAQVQKDLARRQQLKQQLDEMETAKLTLLAEMELQLEKDEAEEEALAVKKLEDSPSFRASPDDSPDETFVEVDESSDDDSVFSKQVRKRNGRGETRAAIDAIKGSLFTKPGPPKLKRKEAEVLGPAKAAKRKRLTVPDGLLPGWQQKQLRAQPQTHVTPQTPIKLGGLDDEDTYAPAPEVQDNLMSAAKQRINTMVEIVSDDEDGNTLPLSKAKKPKHQEPEKVVKIEQGHTTPKQVVVVKAEGSSSDKFSDDSAADSDLDQLPHFARAAYTSVFLPTLYHRLGCSEKPFTEFSKGDEMVAAIQQVVDCVWPESNWTVRWGDKLCSLAYARVGEIRSRFGSRGLTAIVNHFSSETYKSDRTAVVDYSSWASQEDGPGIYRYPAPANSNPKAPNYQPPDGIFESRFFVDVMKWFVKIIQPSIGNFGNPRGAIALTATSIERGFAAFLKDGDQQLSPRFAAEFFSSQCDEYYELAGGLSENNWRRIMATYGSATPLAALKAHTKRTSLSNNRRNLYIRGSSPILE
ncbi:hypothetical protein HWV62_2940 [Athelia sp. TMB]|nr:hypothetical protein HWV62_2940 [Athelia sp. TMB]